MASSASTAALARVMVGVVRVEEGGRGDCVCVLGSMCEGDTQRLRSACAFSSQEIVTTHSRETLPVVVSSWGLEERNTSSLSHTTADGSSSYPTYLAGSTRDSADLKSSRKPFSDPRHSSTPRMWLCV